MMAVTCRGTVVSLVRRVEPPNSYDESKRQSVTGPRYVNRLRHHVRMTQRLDHGQHFDAWAPTYDRHPARFFFRWVHHEMRAGRPRGEHHLFPSLGRATGIAGG